MLNFCDQLAFLKHDRRISGRHAAKSAAALQLSVVNTVDFSALYRRVIKNDKAPTIKSSVPYRSAYGLPHVTEGKSLRHMPDSVSRKAGPSPVWHLWPMGAVVRRLAILPAAMRPRRSEPSPTASRAGQAMCRPEQGAHHFTDCKSYEASSITPKAVRSTPSFHRGTDNVAGKRHRMGGCAQTHTCRSNLPSMSGPARSSCAVH